LTSSYAIEINHLFKKFGSLMAVSDLSFEVHAGDVFGFLGPNGAGQKHNDQDDAFADKADIRRNLHFLEKTFSKAGMKFSGKSDASSKNPISTCIYLQKKI
jgi:ABC-type arginine transport system ATPase subunit